MSDADDMMDKALGHPVKAMLVFSLAPFLMACLRGAQGVLKFLSSLFFDSPAKTTDYSSEMTSTFVLMGILAVFGVASAFARGKQKSLKARNIVSALFLGVGAGLGTAAGFKIGLLAIAMALLITFIGWRLFSTLTTDE